MLINLFEPVLNVSKSLLFCAVIHEYNSHSSFVVGLSDCAESFLTSCVPNLKFHSLVFNIDSLDLEIDAYTGISRLDCIEFSE